MDLELNQICLNLLSLRDALDAKAIINSGKESFINSHYSETPIKSRFHLKRIKRPILKHIATNEEFEQIKTKYNSEIEKIDKSYMPAKLAFPFLVLGLSLILFLLGMLISGEIKYFSTPLIIILIAVAVISIILGFAFIPIGSPMIFFIDRVGKLRTKRNNDCDDLQKQSDENSKYNEEAINKYNEQLQELNTQYDELVSKQDYYDDIISRYGTLIEAKYYDFIPQIVEIITNGKANSLPNAISLLTI